ncbi:unnamed protein product [Ilex paraguariensis]|uniref:X8 domain-containing protein n=1 Tax=Ilex paraguariensis TaxID=185542 RepID=A0ABC8TSH7_9AQUA
MAYFVLCLVLFLAMTGHSSALYCICNSGMGDSALQKNIDYACGAGADCSPILQNGPCYNPNTVKDHCNYAVNSYFQRKGQISGSCDFAGTAAPSQTPPSGQTSACVYPSSPSNAGTPSTTPPSSNTPPSTNTPPSNNGPPSNNNSSITPPSTTFPGNPSGPTFGPVPSGNGISTDNSGSDTLHHSTTTLLSSLTLTLLFSALLWLRV